MSKDTSTLLKDARQAVTELNADQKRLSGLVNAAEQRLREARRGDELAMRKAALEVAGLREALADVERERAAAQQHLDEVEQRAQIEADEAELGTIRTELRRLAKDATDAINASADAALASMQHASKAEHEARQHHQRMTAIHARLGQPAPTAYQPPSVDAILAARKDTLPEDEPLVRALINAARSHPVTRGNKRSDLHAERRERNLRSRLAQKQRQYDVIAEQVERLRHGEVRPEDIEQARQYAAWLERNQRPETIADLEATA